MGRLLMSPCCERISPYDHAAAEGNLKMFTFAENGKRSEQSMEKETALPKNIRQIGEVRGEEKICLEDYVMTCIHKKEQQEKEGYLGIFFGERRREAETEYVSWNFPKHGSRNPLRKNWRNSAQNIFRTGRYRAAV